MNQSNFTFLEEEFPFLFNIGKSAESYLYTDSPVALIKLRLLGERITELLFEENYLEFPHTNSFHNRIKTLEYENLLPTQVKDLFFAIKSKGNIASHQHKGSVQDAKTALFSAFKIAKWYFTAYGIKNTDVSQLKFSMPKEEGSKDLLKQLETDYKQLEQKFEFLLAEREIKKQTEEEKQKVIIRSKEAALKIDMSEAETRAIIDEQLRQAGWEADTENLNFKKHKSLPQKGKNLAIAEWKADGKWADYALFIGLELYGFIEAKKYASDISTDLGQAKVYAEKVKATNKAKLLGKWETYNVPFLFSSNGRDYLEQIKTKSGVWFLDVRNNRNQSRPLMGWFSPQGLVELYEQDLDESDKQLKNDDTDYLKSKLGLSLRDYQIKAIAQVEKKILEQPESKKALLAMATGTGKTRTILGLCYRLIKANRFRRILFLVDRRLLAEQSFDTFKDTKIEQLHTFLNAYETRGLKDTKPDLKTRLHFATVQGMVKRLFYNNEANQDISVDAYDCIIVDEAHRGYLQDKEMDDVEINFKDQNDYVSFYRRVLDYFDAFSIGLTATPALHTREIFGAPVFTYSYREAVIDGFLADQEPPFIINTQLNQEGITWGVGEKPKYYDSEDNKIAELDELEDELNIDIAGFNKLVITESFNRTVVQQLVQEIDPEGEEKTLIFAALDEHADLVVQLLKEEYAKIGLDVTQGCIEKITGSVYNNKELVKRYKNEKFPNIVVTVDLLTTGIDVPPICNLVFLRRVRSRILYEQMIGRATRLCPEINKETFRIYDAVRIYETLEDYNTIKPVVNNPKITFVELVEEMSLIGDNDRAKKQLEQIVAKLHRKKRVVVGKNEDDFTYYAKGKDPEEFIDFIKNLGMPEEAGELENYKTLWKFLDELKPAPKVQYWSEHQDEYLSTKRGYGDGQKPEDYLESFKTFIKENQNTIVALNVICNRPKELDRKTLKELRLLLNENGFTTKALNAAWKDTKNEDIAADIIAYIRTLALGSSLQSHEERITAAMAKVRSLQSWNKIQQKWLGRFEKQLLKETILTAEDIDGDPFDKDGGFDRLNKIFENKLEDILTTLNEELYTQSA